MPDIVSLCLIARNEEANLRRCVESFRGAFDELVVLDTGSTDNTEQIAKELGAKVYKFEWRDDFAAARQFAFDMATGDWLLWADCDEWLEEGHAPKIRQVIRQMNDAAASVAYFKRIVGPFEVIERESLMRRSSGQWVGRIHERFETRPGLKSVAIPSIVIRHPEIKHDSHARNIRILREELKDTHRNLFFLATELFENGETERAVQLAKSALELGGLGRIEKYELLMKLAECSSPEKRCDYAMQAHQLMPFRREALVFMTLDAISKRKYEEALGYSTAMCALPKPSFPIWTLQASWYGWAGLSLMARCLRLCGKYPEANKVELDCRGGARPWISLIHATRGRPKKMIECRDEFFRKAKYPNMVEHVFILDADDHDAIAAAKGYPHEVIDPGGGCVAAWNRGAFRCNGQIIVQLSDDWEPPMNWDAIIMERLKHKQGYQAVLAVSDGIDRGGGQQTKCLCMAIMTRERLQAQGHMFHPSYKSVYSDNEFTDRAYEDGVVVEARDVVFRHKHYLTGEVEQDKTYREQNAPARYADGEAAYKKRKWMRANKKGLDRKYAAFILTTGDNFCLNETMQRMFDEGVEKIFVGVPNQFWDGRPCDYKAVFTGAVQRIDLDVQKHRAEGRHILFTEAAVRNEALDAIRAEGWDHVLVVDDDELWMPGTLRKIDDYVSDNHPVSLCSRMVPVIGVPGYPVDCAQDVAMVYLGPGGRFYSSRSAAGDQRFIPEPMVIHFSATRKTLAEVIEKSRKSGHYTDKDYDFEGWIHNILPNIKPGMKDVHMYRKWSTWPLVREWTKEELAAIPETLKPHIGGAHVLAK